MMLNRAESSKLLADEATTRILNKPKGSEPIMFHTGPPVRTTDFRKPGNKEMAFTVAKPEWQNLVKREPVDNYINIRSTHKSSKSTEPHHKLGFADSESMPLIVQPRVLFDAFQDTKRTGQLPQDLRDGSMPLYFSFNRKYVTDFAHKKWSRLDTKAAPKNRGLRPGPLAQQLEGLRPNSRGDEYERPATSSVEDEHTLSPGRFSDFLDRTRYDGAPVHKRPGSPASSSFRPGSPGSDSRRDPRFSMQDRSQTSLGFVEEQQQADHVPEWQVVRSKSKGFPYWYNKRTGESRWLPPHQIEHDHKVKDGLGGDRSWFNYQPGYQGEPLTHSTGRSTYDLMQSHQKPDFQIEEKTDARKSLQRRNARFPNKEEQTMRWMGASFPPQGRTTWKDKLTRLIADKMQEHTVSRGALRHAWFKMDKDKSGFIDASNLQEILEMWTGMPLDEESMSTVLGYLNKSGNKMISFSDLCGATEEGHPLGGKMCINTGTVENYTHYKEKLISHRVN